MIEHLPPSLLLIEPLAQAFAVQRDVLRRFHDRAGQVLDGVCAIKPYAN